MIPIEEAAIGGTPDNDGPARAERLRNIRIELGWTIQRMADAAGVKLSTMESWLSPTRHVKPTWPNLVRLADAVGKTPEWIETGHDKPPARKDTMAAMRADVDELRGRFAHLEQQLRFIEANTDRITVLEETQAAILEMLPSVEGALGQLAQILAEQTASGDRRRGVGSPPPTGERRRGAGPQTNE